MSQLTVIRLVHVQAIIAQKKDTAYPLMEQSCVFPIVNNYHPYGLQTLQGTNPALTALSRLSPLAILTEAVNPL
jgi:hypothetical protein